MRKIIAALFAAILMLSTVLATGVGTGVGVIVTPEEFAPRVWMDPNGRLVLDDMMEPGPCGAGEPMCQRINNYAFVGEQIKWDVFVWDKNGIEKVSDVYVEAHQTVQQEGYIEANCREATQQDAQESDGYLLDIYALPTFDIYEGEELIQEFNPATMRWYTCILTIETPASMRGEYMLSTKAVDLSGLEGKSAESELWFLNPIIALGVTGSLNFGTVRPGATVLSNTLTLKNNAEAGSGVLLDMFIAGTDFYDTTHSGAMCPDSNVLRLWNFRYYASSGAYNTCSHDSNVTAAIGRGNFLQGVDSQCYVGIPYYMDGAGAPVNNNYQRVISGTPTAFGWYPAGNILSPGADISLNFKLSLPEPCNGGPFSAGQIKFFGEAV